MYTWLQKYSPYMTKKKLYYIKCYSANFTKCNIETNDHQPKAFNNIPGPKSLPVIGTLYKYLPFIGKKIKLNLKITIRVHLNISNSNK